MMPGIDIRRTTSKIVRISPQPSTRAASSSSRGMFRKVVATIQVQIGNVTERYANTSPEMVFSNWNLDKMM